MNAIEARKQRQAATGRSLSRRLREDTEIADRIDAHLDKLRLEQLSIDIKRAQK